MLKAFFIGTTLKDTISNIAGYVVLIATAVTEYLKSLDGGEINWLNLLLAVAFAIVAKLTGAASNGLAKPRIADPK